MKGPASRLGELRQRAAGDSCGNSYSATLFINCLVNGKIGNLDQSFR